MGRGSKVAFKRTTRRSVHPKENGSDESDEEFKLEEGEEFDESDEYCSLDGDESEDLLAEFEEDDEKEKNVKRTVTSKPAQKCSWKRKRTRVTKPQKKRRVSLKVEDDEVEAEDDDYEDEDEDEDEDDEEFILDESDCVDEEVEMPAMKKNRKVTRPHLQKRGPTKGKKRSRKSKVLKKPARRLPKNNRRLTRKTNSKTTSRSIVVHERKRRTKEDSDSDFVSPVPSDVEYTISEEEREQVREATRFCTNFNTSLRSALTMKRSQEEETVCPQRRCTGGKGKEKAVDMKIEVVKQVCGICLSEEGKKTVRGSLDCCSHFFCFACIMEWSKVESRCPLCKQRFMTISKPARSNTGFELRTVVVQVPERDQVYQPSEEELQAYVDPYEDVICTECHQGGEDALMLLCDICDSPAHTFCVGLGREIPDGNWYCEGCQPAAFASLNQQGPLSTPDQRANNMSGPALPFPGGIDLNSMYVPETPMSQENRHFPSIRRPMGDHQDASLVSGTGAITVSDRRRIQLRINNMRNNRTSQTNGRSSEISASSSGIRLFGLQLDQGMALTPQQTIFNEGRLEGNAFALARDRDLVSIRSGHFSRQVQNQTSTSAAGSLQAEHGGYGMAFNSSLVHEQLHPCTSRLNIGADACLSPYAYREMSHFSVEKGQVQQMVKSHLKSLSGDIELGFGAFKNIARQSTHTILAAYGLEHKASEVCPVQPSFVCNHLGVAAGREMSLMKDSCSSCFYLFVKDVVKQTTNCAMSVSPVIGF